MGDSGVMASTATSRQRTRHPRSDRVALPLSSPGATLTPEGRLTAWAKRKTYGNGSGQVSIDELSPNALGFDDVRKQFQLPIDGTDLDPHQHKVMQFYSSRSPTSVGAARLSR